MRLAGAGTTGRPTTPLVFIMDQMSGSLTCNLSFNSSKSSMREVLLSPLYCWGD